MSDDFTPYVEPQPVVWVGSTNSTPMVQRSGPWYTYTRSATAREIATGRSELTAYDLEMLSKYGGDSNEFLASERIRLSKRGLELP